MYPWLLEALKQKICIKDREQLLHPAFYSEEKKQSVYQIRPEWILRDKFLKMSNLCCLPEGSTVVTQV